MTTLGQAAVAGAAAARAAAICEKSSAKDNSFLEAKIATARFYAEHVLVQAPGLRDTVVKGAGGVMALSDEQFLAA